MSELIQKEEKTETPDKILYEKCFLPVNDEKLLRKGIDLCAQTEYYKKTGAVKNRVVFRKGEKEVSEIGCIHTQACVLTKSALSKEEKEQLGRNPDEEVWNIVSTEQHPEISREIEPEQHFIALKSFLDHIVTNGITQSLISSMKFKLDARREGTDVGYDLLDDQTTSQLIKALSNTVPLESKDLVISVLDYMVGDDPDRLDFFSPEFSDIICDSFNANDIDRLDRIDGGISKLPENIRRCILGIDDLSESTLLSLNRDPVELHRLDLARRRHLPESVIKLLLKDDSDLVRRTLLESSPDIPLEVQKEVLEMDDQFREVFAGNPSLFDEIERKLLFDPSPTVRRNLATKFNISVSTMLTLARDPDPTVRVNIARQYSLPKGLIRILADDEEVNVRKTLINTTKISKLPRDVAITFANDSNLGIRKALGARKDLPDEAIAMLVTDPDQEVRNVIAMRKDLSPKRLISLSRDPSPYVREHVAGNPNSPIEALRNLSRDDDNIVRVVLTKRSLLPHEIQHTLALDPASFVRQLLVKNQASLGEDAMKVLANDEYPEVRLELSRRKDLLDPIISTLSFDEQLNVRLNVITQYEHPDEDYLKMAKDDSVYVRRYISHGEQLPQEAIDILVNDSDVPVKMNLLKFYALTRENLLTLAQDSSSEVRMALANTHPIDEDAQKALMHDKDSLVRVTLGLWADSPEVIKTLAEDPSSSVRRSIVKNTTTSKEILRNLVDDNELDIGKIAKYRLGELKEIEVDETVAGALFLMDLELAGAKTKEEQEKLLKSKHGMYVATLKDTESEE